MYESALLTRQSDRPLIGLALGSGAARGWAHIGVIRALQAEGVEPDIVCGCSIGALVGAAHASGRLDPLHDWVCSLEWHDVVSLLDLSFRGGLIRGERVLSYCAEHFFQPDFESLPMPFACVATELSTGRELWLQHGDLTSAVRASIALPGLFAPVSRRGRVLADGGLVNPVPVSVCKAMGADIVIAVELGSGVIGAGRARSLKSAAEAEAGLAKKLLSTLGLNSGSSAAPDAEAATVMPSLTEVLTSSINIMQTRIARSRLAGEPADVLISPRVAHLNMMDFHCAAEAVSAGEAAVAQAWPMLRQALELEERE